MINDTLSAKILWHYILYLQLPFRIGFPEVYLGKLESYQYCFLTVGLHFEKKQSKYTSFWLWVGNVTSKGWFIIAPES